jgi:hypothetical protein
VTADLNQDHAWDTGYNQHTLMSNQVIAFSPNPAALALGACGGGAASASPQGSLLSTLGSFKEARLDLLGAAPPGSPAAGSSGGGGGAQAALAQRQQLVAALHGRISKATAEVEELKRQVEKERARAAARPTANPALGRGSGVDISHSLKLHLPAAPPGSSGGGGFGSSDGAAGATAAGGGACYALALESSAPIFAVGLACSRELLLLDAPGNVAIVSR